jgi:hypothetical protein
MNISTADILSVSSSTSVKIGNTKWDRDVLPEIRKQETIHRRQGIPATVRGLLYIFESMGLLQKKDYGTLSKKLTKWRETNKISDDWIVDKTRRILDIIYYDNKGRRILVEYDENIQTFEELVSPSEHIECGIDYLRDVITDFFDNIPTWLDQPIYLEIWVEKNAMGSVVYSIVKKGGMQVVVAPNSGWSSHTFVKDNLDRLLKQKSNGKEVWVQYYGDSDPSGERMSAPDGKIVRLLEKHGIHFERIAITDDTIRDFKMHKIQKASMDDPQTQAKLDGTAKKKGDPNTPWFKFKHKTDRAWQIEVDALQLDLEKFNNLVLSNVKRHFNENVHIAAVQQVKNWYPKEEINAELRRQVKAFAQELGLDCH